MQFTGGHTDLAPSQRAASVTGHMTMSFDAARVRFLSPRPQVTLHAPHAPQELHGSVVQSFLWQGTVSICAPHLSALPPDTVRVRRLVPQPHSSEQSPHSLHADTLQGEGHGLCEHCWVCTISPHPLPPFLGARSTFLVRIDVLPPQSGAHVLHELQPPVIQSIWQLWLVLHFFVSSLEGQDLPPHEGMTFTFRSRVLLPPSPQVALQSVHSVQLNSSQSFGQQLLLHSSCSNVG
jgi:hypothetical protein